MSAESARAAESEIYQPEITEIARSEDRVELRMIVPEALLYFRGHFPNFAILPGIVQLDWAIKFAAQYLAHGSAAPGTIRIKFRKPIRPNHRVTLTLKYVRARNRIQFDYWDADGMCSSGEFGFGAK